MMRNFLYEPLPDSVEIQGELYPVCTDFRDWLRFYDLMQEDEIPEKQKTLLLLQWFRKGKVPPAALLPDALEALKAFFEWKLSDDAPEQTEHKSTRLVLCWNFDAPFIYAAFLSVYGIDLIQVQHLHWHVFRALFDALPEDTPIKQRMYYRSVNTAAIKDEQERKRIRKIQRAVRVPHKALTAEQVGGFFG